MRDILSTYLHVYKNVSCILNNLNLYRKNTLNLKQITITFIGNLTRLMKVYSQYIILSRDVSSQMFNYQTSFFNDPQSKI